MKSILDRLVNPIILRWPRFTTKLLWWTWLSYQSNLALHRTYYQKQGWRNWLSKLFSEGMKRITRPEGWRQVVVISSLIVIIPQILMLFGNIRLPWDTTFQQTTNYKIGDIVITAWQILAVCPWAKPRGSGIPD